MVPFSTFYDFHSFGIRVTRIKYALFILCIVLNSRALFAFFKVIFELIFVVNYMRSKIKLHDLSHACLILV